MSTLELVVIIKYMGLIEMLLRRFATGEKINLQRIDSWNRKGRVGIFPKSIVGKVWNAF